MSYIVRDMNTGELIGGIVSSSPFTWPETQDECRTQLAHGLEYKGGGDSVIQKLYEIIDLPAVGNGSNTVMGEPTYDAEGDRVTRTVTKTPTIEDVRAECDRRLAVGFTYDFGNGRGVHRFGTTDRDMKGWSQVTQTAQAAINLGMPNSQIHISTDSGECDITALEWQQVLLAAAQFGQPIWQASFALQAQNPIPSDYRSDERWG
jgi:hypothetical protein